MEKRTSRITPGILKAVYKDMARTGIILHSPEFLKSLDERDAENALVVRRNVDETPKPQSSIRPMKPSEM
jgi:hypothetical protein